MLEKIRKPITDEQFCTRYFTHYAGILSDSGMTNCYLTYLSEQKYYTKRAAVLDSYYNIFILK
jgi:hypothetical protein